MLLNLEDLKLKIDEEQLMLRRFERIDWKKIASVNLEQLTEGLKASSSADWRVIEDNISNVLCCHIESEFERKSLDANLVKMFQLAQIVVEYLIHIRRLAFAELSNHKQHLSNTTKALELAVKTKDEAVKKWKELKKSVKQQKPSSSPAAAAANFYKCPWCIKTFLNGDYLAGHLQRRHQKTFISSVGSKVKEEKATVQTTGGDELDELKTRLQAAENQLKQEQFLLHQIINKMDDSNVSLQGVIVQEVQKIRESLVAASPSLTSVAVETVNDVEFEKEGEELPPSGVGIEEEKEEQSETVVAVHSPIGVGVVMEPPPCQEEEKLAAVVDRPKAVVIPTDNSSEEEEEEEKSPTAIDRRLLMERFKKTIEAALEQRMQRLVMQSTNAVRKGKGLRRVMTSDHASQALVKLASTSSSWPTFDYDRMKRRCEAQLSQRLDALARTKKSQNTEKEDDQFGKIQILKKKKKKRKLLNSYGVPLTTTLPVVKAAKAVLLSRVALETCPPVVVQQRAPVPTPRNRLILQQQQTPTKSPSSPSRNEPTTSLMARDGEATTAGPAISFQELPKPSVRTAVNDSVETIQISGEDKTTTTSSVVNSKNLVASNACSPPLPPARSPSTQLTIRESKIHQRPIEKKEDEDDESSNSFSLSSLDAILNELKKGGQPSAGIGGNKYGIQLSTTPKSVQWRVPIAELQLQHHQEKFPPRPLYDDDSWDS